ncbi:MAG: CoA transferase [Rhizobiales bacterium]|nr:CoA transferase [Hyphomicrobiales bacterium]
MTVQSSTAPRPGPLQGIRVIDFTAMLAGPHCARLMADLGAEVIKIEGLEGDLIRSRPPLRDGNSTYFGALNCGKKSLAINLKTKAAKDIIYRLTKVSDVVVENFRPGVMARLGFDYATLSKHNPKLVYCSISGYGQTGSGATRAAYAPIIHAASGFDAANLTYQTGQDTPASTGIFTADILSGAYAFGAIQAALLHRERTGEGQAVDVALMDSMLNLLVFECQEAQFPSQRPRPVYVPMKSTDGHVIIAPISQKNFEQMAEAMQQLELTADARFATGSARVEHWNELMAVMEQWTRRHSSAEIESIMDANGVPCSRFVTVADAMRDTQLTERGSLSWVKDAAGEFIVPNAPFQFTVPTAAGPIVAALGADNTNVLSDILGMSPLEIDALQEQGVLSNR